MINEALHCLQEGIIKSPEDGDLGAILGLGFPPFLGGPFRYIDSLGADKMLDLFKKYQDRFGARFTPAELLEKTVKKNGRFYS